MVNSPDCSWAAFTDEGPWVLARDEIRWIRLAETLRRDARAEVPVLTAPQRFPPGARVGTVVRRLGGALVPWLVDKRRGRFESSEASRADISRRFRLAAEALGPTYIKLGQIISSGEGLFPPELVGEFKKCRDQVPPRAVRGDPPHGRTGSRRPPVRHLRVVRRSAAGGRFDRPGARRSTPQR